MSAALESSASPPPLQRWRLLMNGRLGAGVVLLTVAALSREVPIVGLVQALESWVGDPNDLVVGVVVVFMLVLFVRRARLDDSMISWGFLGFVPLTLLLTEQVRRSNFDITRAVAQLLIAFVLLVEIGDDPPSEVSSESGLSEGSNS